MDGFGSVPAEEEVLHIVTHFNDMLNAHSVDGMLRFLTDDCVFENTFPAPDGTRYEGLTAVRAFWDDFFQIDQDQSIAIEEIFAMGNRCVMRWIYRWNDGGIVGHVRGVDLYTIRDGRISEKLSYVKG
jgi:hypothetical protein